MMAKIYVFSKELCITTPLNPWKNKHEIVHDCAWKWDLRGLKQESCRTSMLNLVTWLQVGGMDAAEKQTASGPKYVRSCNAICRVNPSDATSLSVSVSKSSFALKRCRQISGQLPAEEGRRWVGKCKSNLLPSPRSPIPSDGVWSPTFILSTLIHLCHPHPCSPFMSNEKRSPLNDSARCRGLVDGSDLRDHISEVNCSHIAAPFV